jgi:hypothetical protein
MDKMSYQEREHYANVLFNQSFDTLDDDQIEKLALYCEREEAYIINALQHAHDTD